MSVQSRSIILVAIVVASSALALSLVLNSLVSPVATAEEEVPAIAQGPPTDMTVQTSGDETQAGPSQPQMMNDDGDFWNGWWIIMPIMMVLFWGGVIGLVVWSIRQFTKDKGRDRSPLDIAKERLARGEISKEEFDGIKADLA